MVASTSTAPAPPASVSRKDRHQFVHMVIQICLTGDYQDIITSIGAVISRKRRNIAFDPHFYGMALDKVVKHLAHCSITIAEMRSWTDFALSWVRYYVADTKPPPDHPLQIVVESWKNWSGDQGTIGQAEAAALTAVGSSLVNPGFWERDVVTAAPMTPSAPVDEDTPMPASPLAKHPDNLAMDYEAVDYGSDDGM
jgi:hypothetical protein